MEQVDVVIVGAGPAGLSAALILGRCRRRIVLCDAGHPRNARSRQLSGFLGRDGTDPVELWRLGREQLRRYPNVALHDIEVTDARRLDAGFETILHDGTRLVSRKLLLATGVVDELPAVEGVDTFFGQGVFHCPYCDGWERREQPLAAYGRGQHGLDLALELTAWSSDVVLLTDGPPDLSSQHLERLTRNGIAVRTEPVARLEGSNGVLERARFATGASLPLRALFLGPSERQGSDLAERLGCILTRRGAVETGDYENTSLAGLYVAGDASKHVQLAIVAAAEGAMAAFAINTELLKEDLA